MIANFFQCLEQRGELSPDTEDTLDEEFEQKMAPLRKADRRYWRRVIDDLRQLRNAGQLVPEGTLV